MLVLRVILFSIYASNYENDTSLSLFWTLLIVGPTGIFCLLKSTVYRKKFANFIETLSLLNISLLSAVTWLMVSTGYTEVHSIRKYANYISVVLMMGAFLSILIYQIVLCTSQKLHCYRKNGTKRVEHSTTVSMESPVPAPTSSVVELKDCNSLRESLLRDFN